MSTLRQPDWTEPMGTGIWGLGYQLRGNRGLVLLSNETTPLRNDPDRLWPFILTEDRQRNKLVEQSIAKQDNFSPLLEYQSLGKDDILCVREKFLNELLDLLKKQPIQLNSQEKKEKRRGKMYQEPF